MNAKGETLRPSPAWEALPPGSSLGSSCMETLGGDPRTARPPFGWGVIHSQRCLGVSTASWLGVDGSSPPQERLLTGPGATDNAGKAIPARGVMVPLL